MKMKTRGIAAIAALVLLAGLSACTPPGGGGTGGPSLVGCYPTVFQSSVRITQDGAGQLWWQAYLGGGCSGETSGSPFRIYAGVPGPAADFHCQVTTGRPDSTASDQIARILIPAQRFYQCNYTL